MKKSMFLHIEKTAGTSLVSYLKSVAGAHKFKYVHPKELNDDFAKNQLPDLSIIAGHIKYDHMMKYMNDFYTITFLREPIARVISFYNYAKEVPKTEDPITSKSKELDIIDFLNYCLEVNDRRFVNGTTLKLSDNTTGITELESAKNNLENIDFIGIQENFDESINILAYLNNWKLPEKIPYTNKTKAKKEKEEFSGEVIELITKLNQDDIELYDYGLKLYNERKDKLFMDLIQKNISSNKE